MRPKQFWNKSSKPNGKTDVMASSLKALSAIGTLISSFAIRHGCSPSTWPHQQTEATGAKPPSSESALDIEVSRNTRKRWGLQTQHSVNVARLNGHQSTFSNSKSAHSMKRNIAKIALMTPRSRPNSGGMSMTYEGWPASPTHQTDNLTHILI